MLVLALLSLPYLVFILVLLIGFIRLKTFVTSNVVPKNSFSIVIPFRDETTNLPDLLQSISFLEYPINLFEIILINDDSKDDFETIINLFKKENSSINCTILNAPITTISSKKNALLVGIKSAKFDWIISTDADCTVPKNWLNTFNNFIEEKNPVFISAPVKFKKATSFLYHFQNLNFLSLVGSTIGAFGIQKPFLCNGANLCYKKNIFYQLGGFQTNQTIASGDDIFLLEKFVEQFPKKTHFLKSLDALVETKTEKTWKSFINQQLRWASKSADYTNNFTKFVGLLVFFENLLVSTALFLVLLQTISLENFALIFLLKFTVDLLLIFKSGIFLKNTQSLKFYPFISLTYPFFIVYIALLSKIKKFSWKGRTFKK